MEGLSTAGHVTRPRQSDGRREVEFCAIRIAPHPENQTGDIVKPANEEGNAGHLGRPKLYYSDGKTFEEGNQESRKCRIGKGGLTPKLVEFAYSTDGQSASSIDRPPTNISD